MQASEGMGGNEAGKEERVRKEGVKINLCLLNRNLRSWLCLHAMCETVSIAVQLEMTDR